MNDIVKRLRRRLLYSARDLRCHRMFDAMRKYSSGDVLDVGGGEFYLTAQKRRLPFDSWTVLEPKAGFQRSSGKNRIRLVVGDGCSMGFDDASFDTVLNIQVLEHVFEPNQMMSEMCRVLKPGGYLIALIPQTSTLHMLPHHYYNFTRFWIREALRRNGMQELELTPLGGVWSSMASHLVYFVLQSIRHPGMSSAEFRRRWLFYLLYPLMLAFTGVAFPICLLLSLGDLSEEANNHLVVAWKPENGSCHAALRGGS